jgi:hypothetical protein
MMEGDRRQGERRGLIRRRKRLRRLRTLRSGQDRRVYNSLNLKGGEKRLEARRQVERRVDDRRLG